MKVAVTEVFCEILSGLAFLLVLLPGLDWSGAITFEELWATTASTLDLVTLAGVLAGAYLVGVVLDALGLVFDRVFGGWVCNAGPSDQQKKNFWNKAGEHVLGYRDQVWAYYFCYRNLFILLIPAAICWFGALWQREQVGMAWWVLVILLAMGIVLFVAMRILLKLYYDITKSF